MRRAWAWVQRKLWGITMTMSSWLVSVFWRAFAKWIERDPDGAADRIAALMENMIEQLVVAQEKAAEEQALEDPGQF